MCNSNKIQRLQQAASDLHKVSIEVRTFQDQQKAMHLLHSVADRLTMLADETQCGDIDLHLGVVKARNTATDAMVLMIADDGLVQDVENVAASLATVARWHVQRCVRAAQRTRWGDGPSEAREG